MLRQYNKKSYERISDRAVEPILKHREHVSRDWQDLEIKMRGGFDVEHLSEDQLHVFNQVMYWFETAGAGDILTVGGYAGTGKSTLTSVIAKSIRKRFKRTVEFEGQDFTLGSVRIAFCAYTGKAANVLSQKLKIAGIANSYMGGAVGTYGHFVGTIHSLIYTPIMDKNTGAVVSWKKRSVDDEFPYELVIIDEASMVDSDTLRDIVDLGVPVLAVGDHGQLPPVKGSGSLMVNPTFRLEHIHRQARGNPIIEMATYVREKKSLPAKWNDSDSVRFITFNEMFDILEPLYETTPVEDIAILTYTNAARTKMNYQARCMRRRKAVEPTPIKGDQLICLRNTKGLFNGMRGYLDSDPIDQGHWWLGTIFFPDEEMEVTGSILKSQLGREKTFSSYDEIATSINRTLKDWKDAGLLLDYGYAMTVHKSQGSQFKHVFLLYERPVFATTDEMARWLYTATTRATEHLYIVVN